MTKSKSLWGRTFVFFPLGAGMWWLGHPFEAYDLQYLPFNMYTNRYIYIHIYTIYIYIHRGDRWILSTSGGFHVLCQSYVPKSFHKLSLHQCQGPSRPGQTPGQGAPLCHYYTEPKKRASNMTRLINAIILSFEFFLCSKTCVGFGKSLVVCVHWRSTCSSCFY